MDAGDYVEAADPWYGTYRGVVVGFRKRYGSGVRVLVEISECTKLPCDRAILNPNAMVHRKPYPKGTVQHFAIEETFADKS